MGLFNSMSGLNSYGQPLGANSMMTPSIAPMSFGIVPPPAPAAKGAASGDKKQGMPDGMMNSIMKLFGGGKGAGAPGALPPFSPELQGMAGGAAGGMDPMSLMMMLGA